MEIVFHFAYMYFNSQNKTQGDALFHMRSLYARFGVIVKLLQTIIIFRGT